MDYLFDTLITDLRDLHKDDRMAGAARLLGRPELVADATFRQGFSTWRLGVCL